MRKLGYSVDLDHLTEIKKEIVPTIFTEHQFELINKKFTGKILTNSEKNEFSRTISRKMNAIDKISKKEKIFVYGKEDITRLKEGSKLIDKFSRKFKNKHVIITGSFLYSQKYEDIDIFVISKYQKEDYNEGDYHINYLPEDVYDSLFYKSIQKLCISNKGIIKNKIKEKIDINTFISLYQELFDDLNKNHKGIKSTLRDFLLHASFINKNPIPNSLELKNKIDSVLKTKNPKEIIKNIFINSIVIGIDKKEAVRAMNKMVSSYSELIKEYNQHKKYYLDIMEPFNRVISIES